MKNANKKKWSEMTKKERFWKIFGLVIRLLALAAALAVTISLWVSARRSSPLSASAETVDIPDNFGLGTPYFTSGSGFQRVSSPWTSVASTKELLVQFETALKDSPLTSAGGFFPLGVYFYSPYDVDGGVQYAWTYLIGVSLGDNNVVRYHSVTSGQSNLSDSPPTAIVVPAPSSWGNTTSTVFASLLFSLHYSLTPADQEYVFLYVPLSVNSEVQSLLITDFCRTVFADLFRPEYQVDSSGSGYEQGYNAGYSGGYTAGAQISQSEAYQTGYSSGYRSGYDIGYSNGEDVGSSSSYNTGYSDGQSSGYDSGYHDGLAAGQRADKNVNLDWVINSVGGLFNIKMGTGPSALTFGDIVFTMVSISIFGGVLKLFFGG